MMLSSRMLAAFSVSLLAASPALAMDKREADAACADWKLECPEGATGPSGSARKSGTLECKAKVKGRTVKEGPAVTCKNGEAQSWGEWKGGKKHGLHVTMRSSGAWEEESYAEGKQEGRQVEYSAEGALLKETYYEGGKKHGLSRTYKEDGRLVSEEQYEKGRKVKVGATSRDKDEDEEQASAEEP